jgi:hypothetical protein
MSKPKIKIKKENRGKFTAWAKRHGHNGVTNAAIEEGLASRLASVRKQAQFAKNARKWGKKNV